ncbi:MAG: LamG-like jellyroll fold domain-containing protein [Chloroflexota bacterium]
MFIYQRKGQRLSRFWAASFHVGMVILMLLTACGPANPDAHPSEPAPGGEGAGAVTNTPLEPQYYDAPEIVPPTRTSPEADVAAVELPPERALEAVEFLVTASPAFVNLGDEVTLSVTVRNNSGKALEGLLYTDRLESGLSFVSSSSGAKSDSGTVSYSIGDLKDGSETTFSYTLKVNSFNSSYQDGELWLHTATLMDTQGDVDLTAQAVIGVGTGLEGEETSLAVVQEEGGWVPVGDVAVYIPPDAAAQDSLLVLTEQPSEEGDPEMKFDLSLVETADVSTDENGEPEEQRLALTDESGDEFAAPVFLEVNFDQVACLEAVPAGQEPFIATYYEEYDVWVKLPIINVDYAANAALVQTTHFSTWGAGLGASLPQNGTGALLFDQPYTSLFTGAAQYSIPVWTPPGRAGLSPNVALSYSSGTVNGVLGDVQAPWVGVGWNIDSAEIVRKITTSTSGYGYQNSFALTLNGALYEFIRDEFQPERYYVKQNAFLYIELHNYALRNEQDAANQSPNNLTGEWWEVVMTDGTRYRFGWNADSEQLALMYGYSCTLGGDNCITPSGPYASSGYAGKATNLVARRWRVDRVTDVHGNYIAYTYTESQPPAASQVPPYDRSSYLATISYTGYDTEGTVNDLEPGYQVRFVLADRSQVGDVPTAYNVWDLVDEKYLDKIWICRFPCAGDGSNAVRTYDLGYSLASAPNTNGTLTLSSLAISGGGFSEDDISIPETHSATVRFTYENKPNRASGAGDVFNYPRLVRIENGYGGKLTYTYETDGRGSDSWYNYRVQKADVDSGLGLAARRGYTYATPVYTGIGSNPNLGELIGYTTVTEKTLDYNNADAVLLQVAHQFGTSGLDIGREYWNEVSWGGTVYQKTVNTYVTDNIAAPSSVWNYRYLAQSENYLRSAGALALVSKTAWYRDPATGNLLVQSDYLGASLYRKTYYEYRVNPDPDVYILDTASRVLLVDANNTIYSDTRYHYDGGINIIPTHGDLTLTQVRTGSGSQTVDSKAHYDAYGNLLESRLYESFGTLEAAPSGSYQAAAVAYDTTLHTYPISATNALDETSETEYLFSLGLAYRSTDANGWVTATAYDGLGRTLSVTAPGLGQPGVWYSYPAPDPNNGQVAAPYAIEMQILDQPAAVYRSVWGLYDGLGRILQNQVYDSNLGQLLVTEVRFNALGAADRQSLPHYVSGNGGTYITPAWTSPYTSFNYDPLGRQTSVTAPGSITSSTAYDGLTTTQTDPNGNLRKQVSDGLGRMVQVQEFLGTTLYATTQYEYDEANRLVQVTDALLNTTTLTYNWLGQKIAMDDPDMGVWTYSYDPTGTLAAQTDARSQTLTFVYDDLNRLVEKWDGSTPLATYTYGSSTGTHGLRTGMSDQSGSTSWTYADYGRTATETKTIDTFTESMTTEADWLGRVLAVTYPDGEVLTYQYDGLGRPEALTSNANPTTPLAELAYDQLGRIATTFLGNGVEVTNTYDSALRLATRMAVNTSQVTLLNFAYDYDDNGNITQITDIVLNEVHSYGYDGLNRLASALGETGTTPGGDDLYSQDFSYDKIGNMLLVSSGGQAADLLQPGSPRQAALAPLFDSEAYSPIAYFQPPVVLQEPATDTPTPTDTPTETQTPTSTSTPTSTNTYTPTRTFTIPAQTNTPFSTHTPTSTYTPIGTSTATATPTRSATPTPTTGLSSGLMGYWNFDNVSGTNVPDDSGRSHPGTLSGAQVIYSGYSGPALYFDGVDDYVSIPYHADFAPAGSFTIVAWVNPETIVTGRNTRLIDRSGVFSLQFNTNGYLQFQVTGLTPDNVIGPQLPLNQWNLVIAAYDSAAQQLRLYVNNEPVAIASVTGTKAANSNPLYFSSSNSSERYKGRLDEVRFYNRVLTGDELNSLFNTATATPRPTSTATITPTFSRTPTGSTPTWATPINGDQTIFTSQVPSGAGNCCRYELGTKFYTDVGGQITQVRIYTFASEGGDHTIRIWRVADATVVAGPYSWNITSGVTGWKTYTLPSPITISANTGYIISVSNSTDNYYSYQTSGFGSPIHNGNLHTYIGSGTYSGTLGTMPTSVYNNSNYFRDVVFVAFGSSTPTATPTSTGTPTPIYPDDYHWGSGLDGDLTVAAGNTYNISTQNHSGRTCSNGGDGVAYSVTQLTNSYAVVSPTPAAGCLMPNDEILLINLQGSSTAYPNVGNYEFLRVASVNGNIVYFTTPKIRFYGDTLNGDLNIGTGSGQQRVVIQRVPNYNNAIVNGTLTANAWNGSKYGVLAFRVAGTLSGSGTIQASALGYRGGGDGNDGSGGVANQGESYAGSGVISNLANLGAGGGGNAYKQSGAGAGYGLPGSVSTGYGANTYGGGIYGGVELNKLFFGSGGGGGSKTSTNQAGGSGGNGGGILFIAADQISTWTGSVLSNGGNGSNAYYGGAGGGGAGGSIRIEGLNINMGGSLSAIAGTGGTSTTGGTAGGAGGVGRIAIYYQEAPVTVNATPYPELSNIYYMQPTPTPTPIAFYTPQLEGTGSDGDIQINSGQTTNLSTTNIAAGRSCSDGGDAVAYSISELTSLYARVQNVEVANGCLSPGDEILLINLQGSSPSTVNVGNYEFLRVASVAGNIVYFTTPKIRFYGEASNNDSNIGTGIGQQRVVIQRVPNYEDVIINGTLTASAWNGSKYGVLAFRVAGVLSGSGTITTSALGYGGGGDGNDGSGGVANQGESFAGGGAISNLANLGGGGGGNAYKQGGAGAGYGLPGTPSNVYTYGGMIYGDASLDKLFMGSGGGGGSKAVTPYPGSGGSGGRGGGILFIAADQISSWTGTIFSKGGNGADSYYAGGGGGGAGGSICIEGRSITIGGSISATGGAHGISNTYGNPGGDGGVGRIAVYYAESYSASFTPNYLEHTGLGLSDPLFLDGFEIGDLTAWSASVTDSGDLSVITSRIYRGEFGLQAVIDDNNDIYVQDGTPSSEIQYRARFYLNPNSVSMASGDLLDIFTGYSGETGVFRIQMQKTNGVYQVRIGSRSDSGTWVDSAWYDLVAGWNAVEIAYIPGHLTGQMSLWLGGELKQGFYNLDNESSKVDSIRLGAQGVETGTRGTIYFDDFDSRRYSYIGLLPDPGFSYFVQPDGTSGIDTTINSRFDSSNGGLDNNIYVGEDWSTSTYEITRSLLKFDLSSIPSNATVLSVTLTLTVTSDGSTAARDICVYRLKRDWVESQATWNIYATGSYWQTGGAGGANDYDSTNIGCTSMAAEEAVGTQKTWALSTAAIQEMVSGSWTNKSFLLRMTTESNSAYSFASSDNATASYRPKLVIEYTVPEPTPEPGLSNAAYAYESARPHAVTSVDRGASTDTYSYDNNGNMTCRVEQGNTYNQVYNVENRLSLVQLMKTGISCPSANTVAPANDVTASWAFTYDGDGARVKQVYTTYVEPVTQITTYYFFGGAYEVRSDGPTLKYYSFGGQTILRDADGLKYLLTDHLGSVVAVTDASGALLSQTRYLPFGGVRNDVGTINQTDYGYTGQRALDAQNTQYSLGLMDYRARFYDPYLNRWTQPDTIVPKPGNTQAWNRYSYANNSPLYYTDPSGHESISDCQRNCEDRFAGDQERLQNCKASCDKTPEIENFGYNLWVDIISATTRYWADTPASMKFYVPNFIGRVSIIRTPTLQGQLTKISTGTTIVSGLLQVLPAQIENHIQGAPWNDRLADGLIDVSIWGASTMMGAGGTALCAEGGPAAIACSVAASTGTSLFLNKIVDKYDLRTRLANGILQFTNDMNGYPSFMQGCGPQPGSTPPLQNHNYPLMDPFLNPTMDPFWSH